MVANMIANIFRSISHSSRPVGKRSFNFTAALHKEQPQVSDIQHLFRIMNIIVFKGVVQKIL